MKTFLAVLLIFISSAAQAAWVFPDKSADVTADKELLSSSWDGILADAQSLVSFSASGLGSLPCKSFSILGKTTSFCLDTYSSSVQSMATLVMLLALLLSIFIIFR
ncbi:MAG: hypothetical protein WC091_07155 [Sulfuricellaceae bacterium]